MKRRKAREYALQALFQVDFVEGKPEMPAFWSDKQEPQDVMEFTDSIVKGALSALGDIDRELQEACENWKLDRLAAVDRAIMRMAAYELIYRNDIPPAVSINEALEIAKKFSSQESASFINGILDRIARKHNRIAAKAGN